MPDHGKKYVDAAKTRTALQAYQARQAIHLVKSAAFATFD